MDALTDESIFPFGKYKESGTKMEDVPASYLDWFMGQDWHTRWPNVVTYIENNRSVIDKELKEQGRI